MNKDIFILAAGVLVTLLAFAIPAWFYAHWLALTLSFISTSIFVVLLLKNNKKQLDRSYKTALTGFVVLFISGSAFIIHDYLRAQWQDDLLVEIRHTIDSGIIGVQIKNDMIQSLKYYKASASKDDITLSDAFSFHMGDKLNEDGTIEPVDENEAESVSYHYEIIGDNTVKIIGVTKVSEGKNPDFENHDGQTGMSQFEGIITHEGVEYEKVN